MSRSPEQLHANVVGTTRVQKHFARCRANLLGLMLRLLALNKLLLRRSASAAARGSASFLRHSSSPPQESAPLSRLLQESFQHQRWSGMVVGKSSSELPKGFAFWMYLRRTYLSATHLGSPVAGAYSLNFSFLQRKGFRAWQQFKILRNYRRYIPSPDEVVLGLIGVNVAVYILWQIADLSFMGKHFVISQLFGPAFLLKLYVAGALGGSVFFLLHRTYVEGASAAVNSIILLDVFLFPKNIYYINLVIPVPAIIMGAFIIGSDLWRLKKKFEEQWNRKQRKEREVVLYFCGIRSPCDFMVIEEQGGTPLATSWQTMSSCHSVSDGKKGLLLDGNAMIEIDEPEVGRDIKGYMKEGGIKLRIVLALVVSFDQGLP
ncbi:hypothetical protein AXF42_Ash011537 [Apostasia shenzhenica]|uniref:Peptidase S54 rhomboid domain-containing protein n=1 Tax=Apostasia shenzhenica TaxID=1088818 RepID=A0A2I0BAW3_9ASPA|nr:hypothetical protein AXF42_Ash011537 [Apostasia shenzhenica]